MRDVRSISWLPLLPADPARKNSGNQTWDARDRVRADVLFGKSQGIEVIARGGNAGC
jgi:hypothetical protein